MTTEEQPQDAAAVAAAAIDVGAKVSNMRDLVLAGAGAVIKGGSAPGAPAAPAGTKGSMAVAKNMAGVFARQMMKSSWVAQTDGQLLTDILPVLEGGCIYLPGFLCEPNDYTLMQALTRELQEHSERTGNGVINWSQHHKYENPDFSPTFQLVLRRLEEYFDTLKIMTQSHMIPTISIIAWKPMHVDSHAYGANGKKEDFTMGASFGFTRQLAFKHIASGQLFEFPQGNGDVFAFTSEVNSKFQHGVPKVKGNVARVGPRFSIIAWGRRRTLNERNSTETARVEQQPLRAPSPPESSSSSGGGGGYHHGHKSKPAAKLGEAPAEQEEAMALPEIEKARAQPPPIDMDTVAQLVEKMVLQEQQKQQAKAKPGATKTTASAASKASSGTAAAEGDKTKTAGGGRRRGRVQHSWAS